MNALTCGIIITMTILITLILLKDGFSSISSKLTYPMAAAYVNGQINHDLVGNIKKGLIIADNQRVTGNIYATLWLKAPHANLTKQLILDVINECKKYNCNAIVYNKQLKTIQILKTTDFDKSITDLSATTIFNF